MLTQNQGQFFEVTKPINDEMEYLLQKVLLKDEKVSYMFSGYGCFGFFTDRRIIFIKDTNVNTNQIEVLPYRSIQRYGIVFEKDGFDANVETYITEFLPFRFYFSDCNEAFKLIEIFGNCDK